MVGEPAVAVERQVVKRPSRLRRLVLTGLLVASASPAGLSAQVPLSYGADLVALSRYEWRGLALRDAWVLQPDAFLSAGKNTARITGGVWSNVQLSRADSASGIGYGGAVNEVDPWLEVALAAGPFDLAAGWTGYFYDLEDAKNLATELANTHELYARADLVELRYLVPSLAVWYDLDAVRGAYFEAGLTGRVPLWAGVELPIGSLFLNAVGGYSAGQELNPNEPDQVARFATSGVTHLDFSADLTAGYVPLGFVSGALNLAFHVQRNIDANARRIGGNGLERDWITWVALSLTVVGPRCRPTRGICPTY